MAKILPNKVREKTANIGQMSKGLLNCGEKKSSDPLYPKRSRIVGEKRYPNGSLIFTPNQYVSTTLGHNRSTSFGNWWDNKFWYLFKFSAFTPSFCCTCRARQCYDYKCDEIWEFLAAIFIYQYPLWQNACSGIFLLYQRLFKNYPLFLCVSHIQTRF